jgi:ribonuclease Z
MKERYLRGDIILDVALLGCGGGMPMPERYLSALLLNYRGRKILIDCGEGTQVSMRLLGWGFKTIDIICITHGHGDHIVGLPGLLATIGNSGRTEPLTIIGPEGIVEIVNGLRVIAPYLPYEINIIENPLETIYVSIRNEGMRIDCEAAEVEINFLIVDHYAQCLINSF